MFVVHSDRLNSRHRRRQSVGSDKRYMPPLYFYAIQFMIVGCVNWF
jgi:hypothetical protein